MKKTICLTMTHNSQVVQFLRNGKTNVDAVFCKGGLAPLKFSEFFFEEQFPGEESDVETSYIKKGWLKYE